MADGIDWFKNYEKQKVMQRKMQEMQAKLSDMEVQGNSGGGMVNAKTGGAIGCASTRNRGGLPS